MSDLKPLLIEIGVEEIPAGVAPTMGNALQTALVKLFNDANLEVSDMRLGVTPRRLLIHVAACPTMQADREQVIWGPPENIALKDGEPSKAAEGFARKSGLSVSDFEFTDKDDPSFAYLGGGRYDGLVEQLGGKATPAVGFAMGLERLVLLLQALESVGDIRRSADVYLAAMGDKASIQAPLIAAQLRKDVAGLRVMVHAGGGNFKKQLKRADKSDALVAVIIGEDELEQGVVTIKYLRERKEQVTLKLEEAKTLLAELI